MSTSRNGAAANPSPSRGRGLVVLRDDLGTDERRERRYVRLKMDEAEEGLHNNMEKEFRTRLSGLKSSQGMDEEWNRLAELWFELVPFWFRMERSHRGSLTLQAAESAITEKIAIVKSLKAAGKIPATVYDSIDKSARNSMAKLRLIAREEVRDGLG